MPIYEYQCTACGHEMEALQKMSDAPLTNCPACGKPALNKLMSAGGFILKGSKSKEALPSDTLPPTCGTGACPACITD